MCNWLKYFTIKKTMTLGVGCLLKHVFLDTLQTSSTPKKRAKKGPKPKQIGTLDYCRICGCFVQVNSTGQSSRFCKATENLFFESVRQAVPQRKLPDDLRDLGFTVSQIEDQSSSVCSPCSNQVRSTRAGFSFIEASFQESEARR